MGSAYRTNEGFEYFHGWSLKIAAIRSVGDGNGGSCYEGHY